MSSLRLRQGGGPEGPEDNGGAAVPTARRIVGVGVALIATVLVAALGGCYRRESPPQIRESVKVVIAGNDLRLVRAQGYFTDAVTVALVNKLGWRVSPQGTATLTIHLREEVIRAEATDWREVSASWSVRLRGEALLTGRGGSILGTFSGLGNYSSLSGGQDEAAGLQQASAAAAEDLIAWLDGNARALVPPQP